MARTNSRELEQDLLYRLKEYCDADEILGYILGWIDTDTSCGGLKAMCRDWDIDIDDILEEEED